MWHTASEHKHIYMCVYVSACVCLFVSVCILALMHCCCFDVTLSIV